MARGRKQKYGEPTTVIRVRVPGSKAKAIKTVIKNELKKYETSKSNGEAEGDKSENPGENREV